jgi:low affinity Fe/Cu permease
VENMKKGSTIGLILLVAGIIIWVAYGLYLGFEEIMQALDIVTGFVAVLIIIGIIVLIISIVIEQRRDTKKMKEEIKKEDLEP